MMIQPVAARLLLLSALPSVATAAASKPKVNFLVLFVDDMGVNQIDVANTNLYGYTGDEHRIKTPSLAKLAKEGMTFQHWYSAFHYCSPSRASMLTGRLPVRLGIGIPPCDYKPSAYAKRKPSNNRPMCNGVFTASSVGGLPHNETTTANVLAAAGYRCGIVGKVRARPLLRYARRCRSSLSLITVCR